MTNALAARELFALCGWVLGGFGGLVAVWSLVARWRGESARAIWIPYLAWFLILPPILVPLVLGQACFQVAMLGLSLLCFREYARITGLWRDRRICVVAALAIVCIYYPVFVSWYGLYQAMPLYAAMLVMLEPIHRDEFKSMIQKTCLAFFGVLYFGWFFSHLAYVRNLQFGIAAVVFLLAVVEGSDAFACLWGKLLGRHRLCPGLSPNKTVEGALGAVTSALALGVALHGLLPFVTLPHLLLLSFLLAVFGMCGDLALSMVKRDLGVKDTAQLIPGHGGLLDRFDSLIFTAPVFFHFLRYFYGHLDRAWRGGGPC
jgi:phosphatidate cytidylyltransferase